MSNDFASGIRNRLKSLEYADNTACDENNGVKLNGPGAFLEADYISVMFSLTPTSSSDIDPIAAVGASVTVLNDDEKPVDGFVLIQSYTKVDWQGLGALAQASLNLNIGGLASADVKDGQTVTLTLTGMLGSGTSFTLSGKTKIATN